jgi:hypothetical protein
VRLDPPKLGSKTPRPDISVGDVFVNYVKGEGRILGQWVSAERVIGDAHYDDQRVYRDGVWPYRWPVEPVTPRYVANDGVVAKYLIGDMDMFAGMDPGNWGSPLRNQGRAMSQADGEMIVNLLSSGTPGERREGDVRQRRVRETPTQGRSARREIPLSLRYKVLKRDDFRCVKCGRSPALEPGLQLHVDHIVPWSHGGETAIGNLQCLCADCNLGKSNRHSG